MAIFLQPLTHVTQLRFLTMNVEITCPKCRSSFLLLKRKAKQTERYCPFCGEFLYPFKETTIPLDVSKTSQTDSQISHSSVTLIQEHIPEQEKIQFTIGSYQILQSIGKGGMGEVFLAYDTTCGRKLALKRIRPDLMEHPQLQNRFLKEARITSQLTHPAIIPIYAIHSFNDLIYYTMPFVQGETLKQIFRDARKYEKKGEKIENIGASIPALIRIFLSICQAVAYSHSKSVLHRDLKPENIIVGEYGQIVILDWGLAKLIKSKENDEGPSTDTTPEEPHPLHQLTHIGKVVGTVAYMAPERAMGHPATVQTDIYSLGVILYQILTLKHPFQRESLKDFRENMHLEKLIDPSEVAPYRDVPRSLARVVMKCLAPQVDQRYQTVDELIHDLENYIEGRSEWFQMAELKVSEKSDWEFQENVLIAEHIAITRDTEISDWVSLMISKGSFQENTKIEASVKIGEKGHGIGFLLSIPEMAERVHLNDGYCLWIASDLSKSTKLLRSTVEVVHAPDVFLKRNEWCHIRIEKIDNKIYFYLNDVLQFSYISHLPLVGTHVGLLSRDADFTIKDFFVYVRSQNVMINCLAVPDAFLAHKDYATALSEYRRIGYSFPGRAEGREAMFRAGITLLEQANNTLDPEKRANLYDVAQEEFEKLHGTPGAPLEYLGKALVYQAQEDHEEEAKCFELAYRRYPKHPLLHLFEERLVYRMNESARYHRKATFNFILLAIRYLPNINSSGNAKKLFNSLQKHWEPLSFIQADTDILSSDELKKFSFGIKLAFWLSKPFVLIEIINELLKMDTLHPITLGNAFFSLIELGSWKIAQKKLQDCHPLSEKKMQSFTNTHEMLMIALQAHLDSLDSAVDSFLKKVESHPAQAEERVLLHLMEIALQTQQMEALHRLSASMDKYHLSPDSHLKARCYQIWGHLLEKNWEAAGKILHSYPIEFLSQETSLLHFLYGCWLYVSEGKEIAAIHFSSVLDVPYPHTWTLFSHYFKGKITEEKGWIKKAFLWEKRQLYKQLALFYHCSGDKDNAKKYLALAEQAYVDVHE